MNELTQREMAALGGIARAIKLSAKTRKKMARNAANARWGNNKKRSKQ